MEIQLLVWNVQLATSMSNPIVKTVLTFVIVGWASEGPFSVAKNVSKQDVSIIYSHLDFTKMQNERPWHID
jgi:hypothetical protein